MQGRGMFLKSLRYFIFLFFFILISTKSISEEFTKKELVSNYFKSLENFSVAFIQDDGVNISEGFIAIGEKRLRVEYNSPSKILIILDKDKAMYYNYDLDEDEFFDPKNTLGWYFFEIFKGSDFFSNSEILAKKNIIQLEKTGVAEDELYNLKLYFEDNPLIIRKIELTTDETYISLAFFGHTHDKVFDKKYFKLINPIFFD